MYYIYYTTETHCYKINNSAKSQKITNMTRTRLIIIKVTGGSRGGVAGVATPPLIFKKRRVNSVAIVISTVSTVSEQERNGQGRRDVGKSVHVRQAIMQLYA